MTHIFWATLHHYFLSFLVHFYINHLKKIKKILVIIQRSNGDVFLSQSLVENLFIHFSKPKIDLLINDDTYSVARLMPHIDQIHQFSYLQKEKNRWSQERKIFKSIFRKYDLSINLTSSDRSIIYALLAGKKSISAIEFDKVKSWWKKLLLGDYYYSDSNKHILLNNLESLNLLNINHDEVMKLSSVSENIINKVRDLLKSKKLIIS